MNINTNTVSIFLFILYMLSGFSPTEFLHLLAEATWSRCKHPNLLADTDWGRA